MIKTAVAAAALSLIVGASPAFALFPDFPMTDEAPQVAAAPQGAGGLHDARSSDAWLMDSGWEASGSMPPNHAVNDSEIMLYDGLSFSEDLLDDDTSIADTGNELMTEFDFAS